MSQFIVKPVTDSIFGTNANGKADTAIVNTISDLSGSDTIHFQNNGYVDRLQFNVAGTVTAAQLAGVSGVEQINLYSVGNNSITLTDALVASAENQKVIVIGGNGKNVINASAVGAGHSVDLRGGSSADVLTGGAGNDVLRAGTGGHDTLAGGAGADTIVVSNIVAGDVIRGGSGYDFLTFNTGGNIDLTTASSIVGIERVRVGNFDTTLHLTDAGMNVLTGNASGTVIIGGAGNDNITLGTAGQTILGNGGFNTVHATEATLFDGSNGSTLDGGSFGTLAITGGGTIDFSTFGFTDFNVITVDNTSTTLDLSSVSSSLTLTLGDGNNVVTEGWGNYSITGGTGDNNITTGCGENTIVLGDGNNTVDMSSADSGSSLITSTGNDTVTMAATGQTAILGGGSDNVYIDITGGATITSTINAGGGTGDVLHLVDDGDPTVTLGSGVLGFETIDLTNAGGVHLVTNAQAYTILAGSAGDTIDISSSKQSVVGNSGDDTVNIKAASLVSTFSFDGGEGSNTINLTTAGSAIVLGTGVQNVGQVNLYDDSSTGSTITLTTQDGTSVSGSANADTFNLGSSTGTTVCAGDGNDTVNMQSVSGSSIDHVTVYAGSGDDTIVMGSGQYTDVYAGDGNDTVKISSQDQISFSDPVFNTIDGGDGSNTLEFTSSGTYSLVGSGVTNFATVTIDNGVAATLTLDDGVCYTVNMGDQAATNVTGGSGSETFNFGANGQVATGNGGNDTFNFGGYSGTAVGGLGNDTYVVSASMLNSVTITEGGEGGTDTVEITGGGTFTLSTAFSNVENYSLDTGSVVTVALTVASNPNGYTLTGSGGDDTFKIGAGTGLETNSEQLYSGVTLNGSSHASGDTIEITNAGVVDFTAAGVTIENVENVVLDAATNIKLNDASYSVTGSSSADTIDASASTHNETINGGGGTDTITGGSGNDTITLNVVDQDVINAGTGVDTVVLTGAAGSTVVADLSSGGDEFGGLTGNQSGFENLDASALTGAGVDVTIGASTVSVVGSGQNDTFRFGDGTAATVSVLSGGLGTDTAVFSGSNTISGIALSGIEAIQLSGASAKLTTDASHLTGVTSISDAGSSASQELHLTNSTDLSGVTVSGIESIILDNAATLTINASKISGETAITGSGGSDTLAVTGNLDLTSIALTAFETINLASNASLTADHNDLASVTAINGSAGAETLTVIDNTDISGISLANLETLAFGSAGVKLTVSQAEFGGATGVTTITGGAGVDELNATGSLDLTNIALTAVEKIDFTGTLTANAADLASVTAINGDAIDTVVFLDSTNASNITFTGVGALDFGGLSNQTVTIDGTKLGTVTAITGTSGTGDTLAATGSLDLSTIALSQVETITFGSTGSSTLIVDKADLTGVTAITGGSGVNDVLVINDANTTIDLSGITLSKVETISLGNGNNVLTVGDTTLSNVTSITQAGGTATLILTDASSHLDLTAVALDTEFTAITLGTGSDATNNTLTVGNSSLANVLNINGGGATDTIALADSGNSLNLTGVTLSSIEHITLGDGLDATANTLTVSSANLSGITAITGSTAVSDSIVFSSGTGTVDLAAHGATNIDSLTVDATGAVTAVLAANNGAGMTLNITLADIDSGSSITATGTAFADTFHFSSVTDSGANANAVSSITNFVSGSDHLDLSALDLVGAAFGGNVTTAGVDSALDATHDVVFNTSTQTLIIDLDHSGDFDATHDLQIHLTGVASMSSGDFIFGV